MRRAGESAILYWGALWTAHRLTHWAAEAPEREKTMRYSIIVTVRNGERSLPGFLGAMLEQSCRDLEILLVDRGSVDGTAMLCRGYEAAYPELVRFFRQGKIPVGPARNLGIDRAKGEYLIFADCGCLAHRTGLEKLSERLGASEPDLCLLNGVAGARFSLTDRPETLLEPADLRRVVWKRQLFDDAYLRFPETTGRDGLRLLCKALALSRTVETAPEELWQTLPEPEPAREGELALLDALDDIRGYYLRRGLEEHYRPWLTALAARELCAGICRNLSKEQDRTCLSEYIRYFDHRFPDWEAEKLPRWKGLDTRKVLQLTRQARWGKLKLLFALRNRGKM